MRKYLTAAITTLFITSAAVPAVYAQEVRTTDDALVVLAAYLAEQQPEQTTANDFIGSPVLNAAGENIGEVSNLVIAPDGGVVAAIVGVGGFLGIGTKDVAVPTSNIVVVRQADGSVKLTTLETAESLKAAPEFKPAHEMKAELEEMEVDDTTVASIPVQ